MSMGKCNKIRYIVRIRQMVRRWRNKARMSSNIPTDVPSGHVAVCVGPSSRRFIIRATHLNHPLLKKLLLEAAEEDNGVISNYRGPLAIPSCDESLFEQIAFYISRCDQNGFVNLEDFRRSCHVGASHLLVESRPLLYGFDKTPLW